MTGLESSHLDRSCSWAPKFVCAGAVVNRQPHRTPSQLASLSTQPERATRQSPAGSNAPWSQLVHTRPTAQSSASASSHVASHRSAKPPSAAHARQRAPLAGDRVVALHARKLGYGIGLATHHIHVPIEAHRCASVPRHAHLRQSPPLPRRWVLNFLHLNLHLHLNLNVFFFYIYI